MDTDLITATTVRESLQMLRSGRSLIRSPLLPMAAVTQHLRRSQLPDRPPGREWALAELLHETVQAKLLALRAATGPLGPSEPEPGPAFGHAGRAELVGALQADFRAASAERESWSVMYHRFLCSQPLDMTEMATLLRLPRRTVGRRLTAAYTLLVRELQALELASTPEEDDGEGPALGPTNLPAAVTSFVDRQDDLGLVADRLADPGCRLLSLIGPGGVGKTRLALEAAARQRGVFADGVYLVPLGAVDSAAMVPTAMAEAVGLQLTGSASPAAEVRQHLSEKRVLLVLDSMEHLAGGPATALDLLDLLRAAPDTKLLVTTREPLGLQAEWRLPLQGLPYPDAPDTSDVATMPSVSLFAERARHIVPTFRLTASNATCIGDVCRLVAGLPLAVELAAARLDDVPCSAMAEVIQSNLDFLATAMPDIPERQRSLRAVLETVWGRLPTAQQRATARLSVFRGGFTAEAARFVTDATDGDLEALAGRFVIQRDTDGRFGVHEMLRMFASEKLAAQGDESETTARHAQYYLHLAEQEATTLAGGGQWLGRLAREYDNLPAALEWLLTADSQNALRLATALTPYWYARGMYEEGRQRLQRALEAATSAPVALRAQALSAMGKLATRQGNFPVARQVLSEALDLSRQMHDEQAVAAALDSLADCMRMIGDPDGARSLAEEGLELAHRLQDERLLSRFLEVLAGCQFFAGDLDQAWHYIEQALEIASRLGDERRAAYYTIESGLVLLEQGDLSAARQRFETGLAWSQAQNEPFNESFACWTLSLLALAERRIGDARAFSLEALRISYEINILYGVPFQLETLAVAEAAEGRALRAATLLGAAEGIRDHVGAATQPQAKWVVNAALGAMEGKASTAEIEAAWQTGRAMTPRQAVGMALDRQS